MVKNLEALIKKKSYTFSIFNLKTQNLNHNASLEIAWVILPAIVLIFIALPSFTLLYSMDEIFDKFIVIKVIGHQWYWTYEYPSKTWYSLLDGLRDGKQYVYLRSLALIAPQSQDSFMIQEDSLHRGLLRLLDTDTTVYVPVKTYIQLLITSDDVLHSWAIPSLGIKVDAVPGRLNQVSMFINRPGIFYGQCSEICGVNHGFMPIKVAAMNMIEYMRHYIYYHNTQEVHAFVAPIKGVINIESMS